MMFSRKGATPDLAHTTPIKHSTLVEPLTPTANLKMLISAASPDIRDREMKKVLFRPIENEREKPVTPVPLVEEIEVEDPCQVCKNLDLSGLKHAASEIILASTNCLGSRL